MINQKVTIRKSILKRVEEKRKVADIGIKNGGPNASTFWQGYDIALREIKDLIQWK